LGSKKEQIKQLEKKMAEPAFWDDQDAAQKVIDETNWLKDKVENFETMAEQMDDAELMHELIKEEADEEMIGELADSVQDLKKKVKEFELEMLLSEPYDKNNAILELHPGAGGTESQDWASILLRMYQRWAESKSFKVETLNYLAGDEAGVKSVTLLIKGHNAYGYLKAEKGVHRLV